MGKSPVNASQKTLLHSLIGDLDTIWEEYNGEGVKVGVYDDGIEWTHLDLIGNYDPSLHVVDANGDPIDPMLHPADNEHGTAVAGVIGAVNNETGAIGIAWGATLTGVHVIGIPIDTAADLLRQGGKFDIINQSYGL